MNRSATIPICWIAAETPQRPLKTQVKPMSEEIQADRKNFQYLVTSGFQKGLNTLEQ